MGGTCSPNAAVYIIFRKTACTYRQWRVDNYVNVEEDIARDKGRHFLLGAKGTGPTALLLNVNAICSDTRNVDYIARQLDPHAIIHRNAKVKNFKKIFDEI